MPKQRQDNQPPKQNQLPTNEHIEEICHLLYRQFQKEENQEKYAPVKNILTLLGKGAILSAAFLAPKSASLLLPLVDESPDRNSWKRYNVSYLHRTLKRLEKQKQIEVTEKDGKKIIKLTINGKRKILKYSLDSIHVEKPRVWDTKWRLVLYDVPIGKKYLGDLIRETLHGIGFYAIQDSVYIFPYPCANQIEFLRDYYELGNSVQYMLVDKIENDQVYKDYFGLAS